MNTSILVWVMLALVRLEDLLKLAERFLVLVRILIQILFVVDLHSVDLHTQNGSISSLYDPLLARPSYLGRTFSLFEHLFEVMGLRCEYNCVSPALPSCSRSPSHTGWGGGVSGQAQRKKENEKAMEAPMDICFDKGWSVIIDDVLHLFDVQTTSHGIGGNNSVVVSKMSFAWCHRVEYSKESTFLRLLW